MKVWQFGEHCISDNPYGKTYLYNGEYHRKNGPAIIWENGAEKWYLHGKLHRENGPAITYADGSIYFYTHGVRI